MKGIFFCVKMMIEYLYKVNIYDYCCWCIVFGRWNMDLIMELFDGEIVFIGWIFLYRFFDIVDLVIRLKVRYIMNNRIKKYIRSKCGWV